MKTIAEGAETRSARSNGMLDLEPELNRLAEAVIACAIAVHRELGPGFAEASYQRAMMIELRAKGIAAAAEVPVTLTYRGQSIGEGRIDLLVEEKLVVELKAAVKRSDSFRRQAAAYLKASGLQLALIINFNVDVLKEGLCRVIESGARDNSAPSASPRPPR